MFHPLERLINLQEGYRQTFQVGGRNLLLLVVENRPVLMENRCPHQNVPLHTATLHGTSLRCQRHGIAFDVFTGEPSVGSCPGLSLLEPAYAGDRLGVDL